MGEPARLQEQAGRYALVDGIPFQMPVECRNSPALFAVFPIDAEAAKELLPGNEVHPFRLWNKGLLVVSVINYLDTNIGKYIEFSIAVACTHGSRPAPRLLPGIFMKHYGTGQFVVDLPVSSEVSVKGGKGIWGMPKHQANLDYRIDENWVSSQYDLDGQLCMRIEIQRPKRSWFPLRTGAFNYCAFRGLLMKSGIYFHGKLGFILGRKGSARILLGDHQRIQPLKKLNIGQDPILVAFLPTATGTLDDYFQSWFISEANSILTAPEGMESVVNLGQSQEWLAPPSAAGRLEAKVEAAGRLVR